MACRAEDRPPPRPKNFSGTAQSPRLRYEYKRSSELRRLEQHQGLQFAIAISCRRRPRRGASTGCPFISKPELSPVGPSHRMTRCCDEVHAPPCRRPLLKTSRQCFARRVKSVFRSMRNPLICQPSATVHGVVFHVFVELARQVGARSTWGKSGCALLTACWQQGPATTIS
jgi:hypothetical protein